MGVKIVIAEDETDIRNNLRMLLGMEGYTVFAAPNGKDALDLVREHQPDMVLSDVMMPQMSGHALLQAIREDPALAPIPVVLLTARADRSDVRDGMNLGADDYLTKPFQREELLTCIRAQMVKAQSQQLAAKRAVAQAQHLAHFDRVTNLPNRAYCQDLLSPILQATPPQGKGLVLVMVGLDNLSALTHALGAAHTDGFVSAMAQRICAEATQEPLSRGGACTTTRLGDDRFAVIVPQWPDNDDLRALALQLLSHLSKPVQNMGTEHFPVVSVGICSQFSASDTAQTSLARLELALEAARAQVAQRIAVHDASSLPEVSTTFRMHNDLHRAVERQEVVAYFQPQVLARNGRIQGFESLMRWNHASLGLVSPARFIPLAEDNGQIVPMGAWMLTEACTQAALWQKSGTPIRIAVNVSLRQFGDPHLEQHVQRALEVSGLDPEQLELEITEGTAMLDLQHTLGILKRFKAMGLHLAIDDFGTGYSSLAYLKRFPLDVLKIDQSFVRQLCTDADDQAIARAIVALAHSMGLSVIAEGVETQEQHDMLLEMGCEEIQGYLHGKPMPAGDVTTWLRTHAAGQS